MKTLTESIDFNVVGKSNNADYEEEARAIKAGTSTNSGAASSIMSKINTMQENSNSYKNDARGNGSIANGSDNQKNLAKENDRLASEIESMLPSGYRVFRESNGVWYYKKTGQDSTPAMPLYSLSEAELLRLFANQNVVKTFKKQFTGKKLEKHHIGGVAGNKPTVKQDEVFTLLEKGEAIFTKDQQSSLMRILDFSKAIAGKFDSIAMSGANFLTGQMKDLAQSSMTPAYAGASNISYDINVPVQIFPAQKMDEGEIKSLTSKISDYTIKTINNDMSRRGINGGMKRF